MLTFYLEVGLSNCFFSLSFNRRGNGQNNNNKRNTGTRRSGFKTDAEISKQSFRREGSFEEYNDNEGGDPDLHGTLEDLGRSKGSKFNQFEVNKSRFGVVSTYDNDLYTTKLEKDEFYMENEAIAAQIEKEIESQPVKNKHIEEERGLLKNQNPDENEEFKFSSVYRKDTHQNPWATDRLEKSTPIAIERKGVSPGNSPSLLRKGRGSGPNSPKVGSPLEKSMKQLNLDCPSPTFSEKQQDKFNDFIQKEKDMERKKVTEDLKSYKRDSDQKFKFGKKSDEESTSNEPKSEGTDSQKEEIYIPKLNPDAEAFDPALYGLYTSEDNGHDYDYANQEHPDIPNFVPDFSNYGSAPNVYFTTVPPFAFNPYNYPPPQNHHHHPYPPRHGGHPNSQR